LTSPEPIHRIDAQREAQDLRHLLGAANLEVALGDARVRLQCDFWVWGCRYQPAEITFEHPAPPFNRLFLFFGQGGRIRMNGRAYGLRPEVFYLLPEQCPFQATYPAGATLMFLHFSAADQCLHRVFDGEKGLLELDCPGLARLFGEHRQAEWDGELESAAMGAIWRLLTPEIRCGMAARASLMRSFGPLFSVLETTPPARVRIAELAETMGLSPGALARRFERRFGHPLKKFIDARTLQAAQQMLLGSEQPATAIARALGFEDVHYFHHFFRGQTGCTPQEFRRALKHLPGMRAGIAASSEV